MDHTHEHGCIGHMQIYTCAHTNMHNQYSADTCTCEYVWMHCECSILHVAVCECGSRTWLCAFECVCRMHECVCVTADNPFILCPCLRGAWGHFYAPSLGKPPLPQGPSLVTPLGCSLAASCPALTLCSVNHLCSVSGPDLCFLYGPSILLLFNGDKPLPFTPAETTSISH